MNAKTLGLALLAAGGLALSTSALSNEVVITQAAEKKGGGRVALDFVNTGGATAFEFEVPVAAGAKNVKTSKCLSELPGTHTGACQFNPKSNSVVVIVYSAENKPLPEGIVSLGWLELPSGKPARIEKLLVSDESGRSLPVSSGQSGAISKSVNSAVQ